MTANAAAAKAQIAQTLTGRELEIVKLMAEGKNTKEIAYVLGMSVAMVSKHREHLKRKLSIPDAVSLVHYAIWNGLLLG